MASTFQTSTAFRAMHRVKPSEQYASTSISWFPSSTESPEPWRAAGFSKTLKNRVDGHSWDKKLTGSKSLDALATTSNWRTFIPVENPDNWPTRPTSWAGVYPEIVKDGKLHSDTNPNILSIAPHVMYAKESQWKPREPTRPPAAGLPISVAAYPAWGFTT